MYVSVEVIPLGSSSWREESEQNAIDHFINIFATKEIQMIELGILDSVYAF